MTAYPLAIVAVSLTLFLGEVAEGRKVGRGTSGALSRSHDPRRGWPGRGRPWL